MSRPKSPKRVGVVGTYDYDLIQDGMVVASVSAPTRKVALREIGHYAMMYGQDGPCKIVAKPLRRKSR